MARPSTAHAGTVVISVIGNKGMIDMTIDFNEEMANLIELIGEVNIDKLIKYFNIEYSDGKYHLFIDGKLSTSTEINVVKDELDKWGGSHD